VQRDGLGRNGQRKRRHGESKDESLHDFLLLDGDAPQCTRMSGSVSVAGAAATHCPDHHIADPVFEPVLYFSCVACPQLIEQVDGFVLRHAFDGEGAARHGIERLRPVTGGGAPPDGAPSHFLLLLLGQHRATVRELLSRSSRCVVMQRNKRVAFRFRDEDNPS